MQQEYRSEVDGYIFGMRKILLYPSLQLTVPWGYDLDIPLTVETQEVQCLQVIGWIPHTGNPLLRHIELTIENAAANTFSCVRVSGRAYSHL